MGLALWTAAAAVAWLVARFIPYGRGPEWPIELLLALLAAAVFGLLATALDFGGWNEPDWRAALFVFLGALGVVGAGRVVR